MHERKLLLEEESSTPVLYDKMAEVTGKKTFHVIADVILALILIAVLCVAYFAAPPFNRGFFCNDESIQKPYVSKQTVPSALLLAVGLILALVVVMFFFYIVLNLYFSA